MVMDDMDARMPVMADVARRAGVSVMTVSRVVNGSPRVRPETRARVEAAIADLGYRVNTAARTLAGGRSRLLGVVAIEAPYFGPSQTLFGIEAAARAMEHAVTFVTLPRVDAAEMHAALDRLRDAHADGAIVVAPVRAAVDALSAIDPGMPLVVMCGGAAPERWTVAIDQGVGARLAVRHLLELGHPTVHHVRGPRAWLDADARAVAWREELRAHRLPVPRPLIGDWSPASGYEAGTRLAADPDVSAVFVANDQMALGVLLALTEAGRRVPRDVSVVGFDDTPESEFFSPPLTTVRQDFDELGRRCVELLLDVIDGSTTEQHLAVAPQLVVRRSTGPARRARRRAT